ncbi:uncharacterized protein LOC120990315 isoform X3 [Bufo bufo]|uniref:uncharacterized protein LOC120990315 isoform X3 n=1 Tax=Bufo bufo TaxID=8384 RepID=UPI001ABDF37B|nr:uncharacterized protein LOC120990315 isoform X3 [Bufo bufo]
MATPSKRQKIQEESTQCVWLRLCDAFIRTDGNLICPIIKAETSIRVLFRLQEKTLVIILHKVYKETGMKTQQIKLLKPLDTDLQGNLFIQCVSPYIIDREKINHFKERLEFHFSKSTTVKNISVDQVDSTEEIIQQPMISEPDFEMHKLEICYKTLSKIHSDLDKKDEVSFIMDSIKKMLDEFKEKYTRIGILSQNGKGKSFLLNLLFLLTIDNEEEYQNNNKKIKLPKDITGDPAIEELGETINQLPDVVKDFLKTYENKKDKFKTVMKPICVELKPADAHAVEQSKNLFLSLPNYFKEGGRIDTEPFILPQKSLDQSYDSTTKCIIHLRYGTVYQIKVDYFSSVDLKQQLFEFVLLSRNDKADVKYGTGFNNHIKDKAYECLQSRFGILTDSNISDINEEALQTFNLYSDIVLSEEVEKFAGRTELYIGYGRNSTDDRLAVKAILKDLTSPHNSDSEEGKWKYRVAAVKEIVVYLPSKLLYGGKEILEMPGADDSDALALDFINKALSKIDAVFVVSEFSFKIIEKEVKDILIESDFMQKWKKHPDRSAIMLLAYPEKNANFQFKNGDRKKIESLKIQEKQKRSKELKELSKLIGRPSLSKNMEAAVFTSYILPVLHTSIHAQEGAPNQVIQEHACFLKYTGIKQVISHLDTFISSARKKNFQQLQKVLTTNTTKKGLLAEDARALILLYDKKNLRAIRENELFRQFETLLSKLSKNLITVYTSKLDGQVKGMLAEMAKEADEKWESNKENITSIGVFNPHFSGNHPTYKVKIARIILNNTDDLKSKIFPRLKSEIPKLLKMFKKDTVDLFANELNSVIDIVGHKKISSRIFVEQSIQDVMSEAQQWYIGRIMQPINEHTIEKYLKESKKVILRKHILIPAYNQSDLNHAKQLVKQNITKAVMAMKKEMQIRLSKLHDTRWRSFCSHLKTRNKTPKPWQVLLCKLRQFYESENTQQPDELSALLKLITANNPK